MHRTHVIATAAAAAIFALAGIACAGVMAQNNAQADESATAETSEKLLLSELAEIYPLQYDSFATLKTKDGTESFEGHYSLGLKLLAPIERDGNTILLSENEGVTVTELEYDDVAGVWYVPNGENSVLTLRVTDVKGCYQCKSSYANEYIIENGEETAAEPLDEEFVENMNGQIWDCYLCHDTTFEQEADATVLMFSEVGGSWYDELTAEDRVCGQCHNHAYHKPMFLSGMDWSDYQPFKYGHDVDSVLAAEKEYGFGSYEESTGITTYRTNHAELEVLVDSNHYALGITCVDCHMPTVTDEESGEAYTDHNASQSPLENEAALEYCLTCHASQGIETTEDMVAMVRELQNETTKTGDEVSAKLATLHDLIADATATEGFDEDILNEARETYTTAKFYMEWGTNGNGSGYVKVVHNPELITSLLQRAGSMIDEAIALFE